MRRLFHLVIILGAVAVTLPALLDLGSQKPVVQAQLSASGEPARAKNGAKTSALMPLNGTPVTTWYVYLPLVSYSAESEIMVRVVNRTNFYRAQAGCPAVVLNRQLASAAQRHSTDMALNDFFDHIGSDGSTTEQRIEEAGYLNWQRYAENIAAGYTTPEAVVDGWMASPGGHRDNILDCKFQDIGVGYYYLENDTGRKNYSHYWTQVFGTAW